MENDAILDALLAANGTPVSGDKLARALGVSRVSVWERLRQLRREGFEFAAAPRVGYRLTAWPRVVHGGLVRAWLRRLQAEGGEAPAALPVHALAETDSTNDEAGRRLAAGEPAPFAVLASAQTGGRGRRGRVWESRDSGNLYMSFAFRPLFTPANVQSVTLAIGLALCEALSARHGLPVQVKWPNDLMCENRKIAGILTEARMDFDQVRDIVFGVGLNVNGRLEDFPAELQARASSLAIKAGHPFDINETAALCTATVRAAFDNFLRNGRGADFDARWERADFLRGKTVNATGGGHDVSGIALGLAPNGALRVRSAHGPEHTLESGEVTLSPIAA